MSNHVNEMALEQCYEEVMGMAVDDLLYRIFDKGNDHDYEVLLKIVSDVAEELFVDRSE
tara:strand:+ start:802 stop:978 length:177 start_codon:yes stop_codon:yes gene_type:complete